MAFAQFQKDVAALSKADSLYKAADDVDKIIEQLERARAQVAEANDPHQPVLTMTKLQNPIREGLETLSDDLKGVHRAHNKFSKALQQALDGTKDHRVVKGDLPTAHDPMRDHDGLINRAIAMHLLREGQFHVASAFVAEAKRSRAASLSPGDAHDAPDPLESLHSEDLQHAFEKMYEILSHLKAHDLLPAIYWARENSAELDARESNLEWELCKLQFIWLFKGGTTDTPTLGVSSGDAGRLTAFQYARANFPRFQKKHLKDIQRLSCAMVYACNITDSPYRPLFATTSAFEEAAVSFTRDFCSLLGLSASSPLSLAVTAGALALPQLIKFVNAVKGKGTEWTTDQELAFETPLPASMVFHSIFVCPVSKEQTTSENPPSMLPCGHVLASESLTRLARNGRFKCPYCPTEATVKEAREIIL